MDALCRNPSIELKRSARKKREPMPSSYKFNLGDIVTFMPARNAPSGVFEVIKQLPGNGEPEYRVKSSNEPHQRLARESELIKA